MLVVELYGKSKITKVLEKVEEDGSELLHTEGVLFKSSVFEELKAMEVLKIEKLYTYNGKYAFGIVKDNGVVTYISPLWVKSLRDETTTIQAPTNNIGTLKAYVDYGDKLLNVEGLTILNRADLKVCGCCGAVIEEDETLNRVKLCRSCFLDKHFEVKNYSYKPEAEFIGKQIAADVDTPIWYGVELEYGLNDRMTLAKAIEGEAIYLKSDASIEGGTDGRAEMVTHPHSFTAIMAEGSWASKLDTIDANSSTKNGCHIHVSRTAWANDKHYALTYYLMYEMGQADGEGLSMLEHIGGRAFTNYCKHEEPSERIHRLTKDGAKSKGRTLWLNENCDPTIEFRFFGGTNKGDELKRYVQLLDAVIKYTRYHKKSVSIDGLVGYIKKYARKYGQLNEFLEANANIITARVVTYTEPQLKGFTSQEVPYLAIKDIVAIKLKNGESKDKLTDVFVEDNLLCYTCRGSRYETKFSNIESVTVEF